MQQSTVNPDDGQPRDFAFLGRPFEIADLPTPILACVMVTVSAGKLIQRTI